MGLTELASLLNIPYWIIVLAVSILFLIAIWSLIWKGLALWKSARLNQPIWFFFLLIVNTIGILEILYIFIFSKPKNRNQDKRQNKKRKR